MSSNPNPSRVTEPMWWFWEQFRTIEPTVQLGGIYAAKPGYHNTRDGNSPTNYSVIHALDKLGPGDKAAAIDLTFPDAQAGRYATIIKYATRLLKSGQDPHDERGNYLREFYGQADGDLAVEGWDFQSLVTVSSDSSHLWHIHLSFIRAYLNDWAAFRAVLSILSGQTVEAWRAAEAALTPPTVEDNMAKLIIVTGELVDGKPADKVCVTDYATRRWLTPEQLGKVMGKAGLPFPGERVTSADADATYGPDIATLKGQPGAPGAPGPATLVPHTHGPAVPTAQ